MRFVRGLGSVLGTALIALVFAGYPAVVRAQTTSASVSGSIQDSQGAVLPGVTVTMTSRTQGNVLTAITDAGGQATALPADLSNTEGRASVVHEAEAAVAPIDILVNNAAAAMYARAWYAPDGFRARIRAMRCAAASPAGAVTACPRSRRRSDRS